MPKINRLRIVNFSYNGNNRHVLDETFDFYGGENALLSLANGGGKSVLVQAMLQPILPKATLLGRKFGDFFISKKTPAYILIEWLLEEDNGYLLTGIAVTNRLTHSTDEEEQNAEIRYFTFINSYDKANPFDIAEIPVAEQNEGSIRIANYNEFKKLLQREANRNNSEIFVYDSTREDQSLYEKKLSTYRISREEWKELMVKINEAENGVSQVFTECKTSRRVMEQWVIKYIEKVLDKSQQGSMSDNKKLETMMRQVAQALVENENHIKEYELINNFHAGLQGLKTSSDEVLKALDLEDGIKSELAGFYEALVLQDEKFSQELSYLTTNDSDVKSEQNKIYQEEQSQEYHEKQQELLKENARVLELTNEINNKNAHLDEVKQQYNLQLASEKYKRIERKEREAAELEERLINASKDEEELKKNLNRVKISLKQAYLGLIKDKENEREHLSKSIEEIDKKIRDNKDCASKNRTSLNKQNVQKGEYNSKLEQFKKEEQGILKRLGIELYRNPILQELDEKEVIKLEKSFDEAIHNVKSLFEEKKQEENKTNEYLQSLETLKNTINQEINIASIALSEVKGSIDQFELAKKDALEVMSRFNIAPSFLFDPSYLERQAREDLKAWENKTYNLKMEINEIEKRILGIETGVSYMPARLVSLLQEQNLDCYTGERYLRELDEDKRKKLVEKNPLFAYSLLVTEKDGTLIQKLCENEDFSQIVPLIHYNMKDEAFDLGVHSLGFLTSNNNSLKDGNGIKDYVEMLNKSKVSKEEELLLANRAYERMTKDYVVLTSFSYAEQGVKDIFEMKVKAENKLKDLQDNYNACESDRTKTSNMLNTLKVELDSLKDKIGDAENKSAGFKDYLEKNSRYMEDIKASRLIEGEIDRLERELKELDRQEQGMSQNLNLKRRELSLIDTSLEDLKKLLGPVKDAEDSYEPLEGVSLSELEGRYEAYKKQQSDEVKELSERISFHKQDIGDLFREIGRLSVKKEEYEKITYSELREKELELLRNKVQEELSKLEDDIKKSEHCITRLNTECGMIIKNLLVREMEALPVSDIKGNFETRKKEANNKLYQNNVRRNVISKENKILEKLMIELKSRISDVDSRKSNGLVYDYSHVKDNIAGVIERYKAAKENLNKIIRGFTNLTNKFVQEYGSCEEGAVKEASRGLKTQLELLEPTFDKYYYLNEKLDYYIQQLSDILKIMKSRIEQLEHSRNDLTEHAFMEAKRIYFEIPKISENSAVEIDGTRRKVLDIQYKEMDDEIQAREKMSNYISECLESLIRLIKDKNDESRLNRELEKLMATKELLNVISPLEGCVIKAYKVDINEKNRRMLPWEDIIIKNSGGEKFVAYFSLLVALISYSRKQIKGYDYFKNKEESKVLIMDNPFGPITSGHLLKPMFDIADKYNTQLICLSDIKQGSVVSSFNLIYMVKIRQDMMKDDYLELEPVLMKELKQDERLEKVYFYSKEDQISLFE